MRNWRRIVVACALVLAIALTLGSRLHAACCYFSAKNADILQPAQKVFITWDPVKKLESFTVQPKFEGNALDFGMVIPTPTQPKLHEMPRDFFKHLAVLSILKKREFPQSQLLPSLRDSRLYANGMAKARRLQESDKESAPRPSTVVVIEAGVVGSLDYKIIEAGRADDLFQWLKANNYSYAGDETTLDHYVKKSWMFTVMKIDTMQMKRRKDGTYDGEVTPTRFQFASDKLVYPLKITQLSVKDKTEALFYVQAPFKVDLQGDLSYQYTWIPMLQAASGCTPGGLPGYGGQWLEAVKGDIPQVLQRCQTLGFNFVAGQRPLPNKAGHIPTTMEWARKLTADDIAVLRGEGAYCEKVPNVDEGFTQADLKDAQRAQAIYKVINARLAKARQERPFGYLVREAPEPDVRNLNQLIGHLTEGAFITKFRKIFARDEMDDDLVLVAAERNNERDVSEYTETLPVSPP